MIGLQWMILLAAAVAFNFLLSHLPASADLILARRPGFWFFKLAMELAGGSAYPAVFWLNCGAAAAAGLALGRGLWRPQKAAFSAGALAAAGVGGYLTAALLLKLIGGVWFGPESLDWRASAAAFLAVLAVTGACAGSVRALLEGRFFAPAAFLSAALVFWGAAHWRWDAGKKNLARAAGIENQPRRTRTLIVLTQSAAGPESDVRPLPLGLAGEADYSTESLEALKAYIARGRTFFTRQARRHLYSAYSLRMEPENLRRALLEGHRDGDPLAALLLLGHLSTAPGEPPPAEYLDALSDETAYRVGPKGAALLAAAFGHFNLKEKADYWEQKASLGAGAVSLGLLALQRAGVSGGVILGSVRGAGPGVTVGLYARKDQDAPYVLGPAQFVDAVAAGKDGEFQFTDLAAGYYFLAIACDAPVPAGKVQARVLGHKGDIKLTPERPMVNVGPLVLRR